MKDNKTPQIFSRLACQFCIAKEKIPQHGEDSYCYGIREDSLILGVFDGCGGAGARQYPAFGGRTGAYIGARAVSGAVRKWFENAAISDHIEDNADALRAYINRGLANCTGNVGQQSGPPIKGLLVKNFPTTAAIAHCTCRPSAVSLDCFWAGDSRVYLLNSDGLAQLTADDLDGLDAFENISSDGVLTNLISASTDFTLHSARFICKKPFVVLTATDGCFGYIPSPMEFELLLLQDLIKSGSPAEFEKSLTAQLEKVSGDDFTLVGAAFGYGSFAELQTDLTRRYRALLQANISELEEAAAGKRAEIWAQYKTNYYRLMPER